MKLSAVIILAGVLGVPLTAQSPSPREILKSKSEAARQALQQGQYAEAVELYRELATLLPHLPGPKMNLGISLYMDGRYQEAEKVLRDLDPGQQELLPAQLFLGASRFQLGQSEPAVGPLQAYLKHHPDDLRARSMLAEALLSLGRHRQASQHFRRLAEQEPDRARWWHGLGQCYEALAQGAFQELDQTAPESAYWLALLADLRLAQQQYQSAFFLYRKALEKKPLRGLHIALAQIYRATGHPDWAEKEQEKELQLGLPDCETETLVCDFLEGRLQHVVDGTADRHSPAALYWSSKAYNRLALAAYTRLAQLPPSFELYSIMAETHRNNGRHQEAARQWRKALELSPGNPVARRELATSLFLARDYDEAEPLVSELLKEDPDSAQLNFLAGAIRLNQERVEEAIPLLEKAVQLDPQLLSARSSLGRAYLALGNAEKAIPHLETALPSDQDGSLHYQLSRAYQSAGRSEQAREMLAQYQTIQRRVQQERSELSQELKITPPR